MDELENRAVTVLYSNDNVCSLYDLINDKNIRPALFKSSDVKRNLLELAGRCNLKIWMLKGEDK
jgi:hypothetical protein